MLIRKKSPAGDVLCLSSGSWWGGGSEGCASKHPALQRRRPNRSGTHRLPWCPTNDKHSVKFVFLLLPQKLKSPSRGAGGGGGDPYCPQLRNIQEESQL